MFLFINLKLLLLLVQFFFNSRGNRGNRGRKDEAIAKR
jgi:hypothetical protein